MKRILVTGATGQIGSELTLALRDKYGAENVVAAVYKTAPDRELMESGPFRSIEVTSIKSVEEVVKEFQIDTIYHLAAILSSAAESRPHSAWRINMEGLTTILEIARLCNCSVFFPSSIGAFGPSTPADNTPQDTIQRPTTLYGITKVSGELLCDYYYRRFGVDARGLRYPGLISHKTPPGGGTTDYAVEMFYHAIENRAYECFLKKGTRLDMMYMPDAIRAALTLMEADPQRLKHRNAFNVTAMSLTPDELYTAIKRLIPDFTMTFRVDPVRQAIADSWPHRMDDGAAREEWGWQPEYDLSAMTRDMIEKLRLKLKK